MMELAQVYAKYDLRPISALGYILKPMMVERYWTSIVVMVWFPLDIEIGLYSGS